MYSLEFKSHSLYLLLILFGHDAINKAPNFGFHHVHIVLFSFATPTARRLSRQYYQYHSYIPTNQTKKESIIFNQAPPT